MSKAGKDIIRGLENAVAHARGQKDAARETVVPVKIPAKPTCARRTMVGTSGQNLTVP